MLKSGRSLRSLRLWVPVVAVALWAVHAWAGPGLDFFGAYRCLVLDTGDYTSRCAVFGAAWLRPILTPFALLPGRWGYLAFNAASLLMLVYSAAVLQQRPTWRVIPLLLSAQVMWILWWGQIDAVAVLGLALALLAGNRQSWALMALGLALVLTKPHLALVPGVFLWWQLGRGRWKCVLALAGLVAVSLVVWGPWPLWIVQGMAQKAGDRTFGSWNASIGWLALPLLVPAALVPLDRPKRLLALTATGLLISPYLPYYSTVILLCFTLPWWAVLFAFLGYFPTLIGTTLAWNGIVLLPIAVLIWLYVPLLSRRRAQPIGKSASVAPAGGGAGGPGARLQG